MLEANGCVVILSGGMDSTTLTYELVAEGHKPHCLSFVYGQRHEREVELAKRTAEKLGLPHTTIDIGDDLKRLIGASALTGQGEIPHGHYADENMKLTVVPNRNMILLSIAIGYAISNRLEAVAYGAHFGDHAIYPDCRTTFVYAMQNVARICHFDPIRIYAPYLLDTKTDICRIGLKLGVPYEDTWTCYEGGERPCGKCGSCVERAEAFQDNCAVDPLVRSA